MKIRKPLLLLACLGGSTLLAQTPPPILFQDDFETAESDGTPSIAIWGENALGNNDDDQWVRVTNENSEEYFGEADNNSLHIYSNDVNSAAHWITANNQFEGSSVVSVHFDFQRGNVAGTNNPGLRLGVNNPIFNNSSVHNTIRIDQNGFSGRPVIESNTTYHAQIVYNNSSSKVTYLGGKVALLPDSYDVWLDGVRVMTNVQYVQVTNPISLDTAITSFAIGDWSDALSDFRLDNLVIYDGAYAVGEAPPTFEEQIIFSDDFAESEPQAEPNSMLAQPLAETWKRGPTSVNYPGNIIEVTSDNSEVYFGEPDNNYLRFFKDQGEPGNLHLTAEDAFDPASDLITISFDFYEPSNVGGNADTFEIIPGIKNSSSINRTHKVVMSNGGINGRADLYQEYEKNNTQINLNNSAFDVTYLDGAVSLAADTFDVWVNGRRVLQNAVNTTGISTSNPMAVGTPLSSVQFIIWAGSTRHQEFFLDNVEVFNYPHVENPDLTVYPRFADDFSEPVNEQPDSAIWGANVAGHSPPERILEVTDADSETYFGESGNNYMRMFHDGGGTNLTLNAQNRFSSEVITIAFDFFEPADYGDGSLVLRPGFGSVPNSHRVHEITFNNGNLSGVPDAYLEGVKNRIEIVMNNSPEHLSYLDGEVTVASNSYDVWLNGVLILNNHQYRHGGTYEVGRPLSSIQFAIWNGNTQEFLIDYLEVYEQIYIPNPIEIPDLPGRPAIFADDFDGDSAPWLDQNLWKHFVEGEQPPARVVEIANANSETYFGEPENGYLRIYHSGSANRDLFQNAQDAFDPSSILTISFDFYEPAGVGNAPVTLRAGIGSVTTAQSVHEVTFNNGNLSGIADAYEENTTNNIQVVINNGTSAESYHESRISKTIASNSIDIWLNGELILADHELEGALALGTALSSLQLGIWGNGSNELLIDNLEVFDYATARGSDAGDGITFADWAAANLPEGLRGPEDEDRKRVE